MQYTAKAQQVAGQILEAFKSGNLPKALAPVFIRRKDLVPCRKWSWCNQLLCVLNGTADARGIRQWNEAGRSITKGTHGFHIFVPLLREIVEKNEKTGQDERRSALYGFKTVPVFSVENTEGEPLPVDMEVKEHIDSLPLVEVARSWGLNVDAFDGRENGPVGKYGRQRYIAVGVKNLSTWAHELIHAADDKLNNLEEKGQHWRSETVAELGGAILLECLGLEQDSDRGECFRYIESLPRKQA